MVQILDVIHVRIPRLVFLILHFHAHHVSRLNANAIVCSDK